MRYRIQAVLASVLVFALMGASMVLAIDAYEFERTGECRDCVLLTKIRGIE